METENINLGPHKNKNKIHPFVVVEEKEEEERTSKEEVTAQPERDSWGGKLDFIFSALSYSVGLGAVWRFPYLCYQNGGGAFLIPFLIFMVLIGVPMMYLELAVGQFTSRGPVLAWVMTPLFKGVGISMNLINNYVSIYYIMILGYSLYYIILSFTVLPSLPWEKCRDDASINCVDNFDSNVFNYTECSNGSVYLKCNDGQCYEKMFVNNELLGSCGSNQSNLTSVGYWDPIYPSQDFWNNVVLKRSDNLDEFGGLIWQLVLCLGAAWVVCFFCLFRGVKLSGKIVYFTALFPYLVLIILGVYGWSLEGADVGLKYFISPKLEELKRIEVWKAAAVQVFFTLSLSYGGLIALSSYNKFENNILRDTIVLSVANFLTCILAGMVVFAYIGNLAVKTGLPVDKVVQEGQGLIYVVYPYAVTLLPASPLWAIMFFLMMLSLGMGTMMASVETLTTSLEDFFPILKSTHTKKATTLALICFVFFLIGLLLCTHAGTFWIEFFDTYAAGWAMFSVGIIECISVSWFYGVDRFEKDLSVMFQSNTKLNSKMFIWWKICWTVITPVILGVLSVMSWVDSRPIEFGSQPIKFPYWSLVLGELVGLSSVIAIPAWMIYEAAKIYKKGQSFGTLIKPDPSWHPASQEHQHLVKQAQQSYETPSLLYKIKNIFK